MSVKDKLQIFLITYNRKTYLKRTFEQILAENSPIRDFDITVLDNASTDGSSELIAGYCAKFPNLKHVRHKINVGGNANICKAFELGGGGNASYIWVICDDDKFDFSGWSDVEREIENNTDIICVSNYICDTPKKRVNPAYQLFQLTFVPAGIYRRELINDNVLINMYDSIFTMFQQACITTNAINTNKKIKVMEKYIVDNGLHYEDACEDCSYSRGSKRNIIKRRKDNLWVLGYANILTLLDNRKDISKYLEIAIPYKDIYGGFQNFYNSMYREYFNFDKINYFIEIFQALSLKRQICMALFLIMYILSPLIYFYTNPKGLYVRIFNILKLKLVPFKQITSPQMA